jgi:hypothetical protein
MTEQLHGRADYVVSLLDEEARRHGRIDAA